MRIETQPAHARGIGPSAVTIGKFDGVHSGHRAVIDELMSEAHTRSLAAVVVTFDRNPLSVIAPEFCPVPLVSNEQKLALLAGTGIDATLMLTFDEALMRLSPDEFVEEILVDALEARIVLVGSDFRFGARGAGDISTLMDLGRRHGYEVRIIDDVRPEDGRRVSSTWIRELLDQGDIEHATRLLGHEPVVRGMVVHGAKRGRELGFPTANLSPASQGLIPADGVYAGRLTVEGRTYRSAISVGNNPTFEGVPLKQVEAYVLDETLDLYDKIVDVTFVARIRGMVAFTGIEPLVAQMNDDVRRARILLP